MAERDDNGASLARSAYGQTVSGVVEYILECIRSGEYGQGQQLIARNIAATLGTSVAPVREALHRLSGEGIVELSPNRSARVRMLSIDEIQNALEVWEVHAGLMARLAAERIKIRNNADRVKVATRKVHEAKDRGDVTAYAHAVTRFQETLADISENPFVQAVRKTLHTEFWGPQFMLMFPKEQTDEYLARFDCIEAAILSGDPVEAERQYASHVKLAADTLRALQDKD